MSGARIPSVPLALTLVGLMPLVALALSLWLAPGDYQTAAMNALTTSAAVILSFMGGVQWGLAVATHDNAPHSARSMFLLSVVPCLLAWTMLFLPASGARLIVAIFLFGFVWMIDALLNLQNLIPAWLFRLRSIASSVALACLIVALLAV